MRIAVLGPRGHLGSAIVRELTPHHEVVPFGRERLDITDTSAVIEAMQGSRPHAIINCASFNDVDAAEERPVEVLEVNAFAVRAVARAAAAIDATLVHYSTDFVFDGDATQPYTETDQPNPRSVYATSKLLGEWFANDAPRAYVLRVESLFGPPGARTLTASAERIFTTLRSGGEARVFEDRTVSPTFVVDAARATRRLLESVPEPGLYHCVNSGRCTWVEFAGELARQLGIEPRLVPIRLDQLKLRAERPKYCALSNEKLRSAGIEMPTWQDAVARYVKGHA